MKKSTIVLSAFLSLAALNVQAHTAHASEVNDNDKNEKTQVNLKTSKSNLEFRVQHLKEVHGKQDEIDKLNSQIKTLDSRIIKEEKQNKATQDNQDKKLEPKKEEKKETQQTTQQETQKPVSQAISVRTTPATHSVAPKTVQVQNVPTVNTDIRSQLVVKAKSLLGIPYVWGGTNPASGLDCSGLTSWCYSQIGKNIGRTTYNQDATGTHVSLNDLQPGDLILEYGKGHVAMYIGNGQQIEAPQPGESVKISNVPYSYGAMYGLRYL